MTDAQAALREVRDLLAPQCEKHGIQLKLDMHGARHVPRRPAAAQASPHQPDSKCRREHRVATAGSRCGPAQHRARSAGITKKSSSWKPLTTARASRPTCKSACLIRSFSTKDTGTGLGPSIAARIVEKHGGPLEFQTQPHSGTTFGIILPAAIPNMANKAKILLIEDDPSALAALERVLREEDYQVTAMPRGDTGLARARDQPFDARDQRFPAARPQRAGPGPRNCTYSSRACRSSS